MKKGHSAANKKKEDFELSVFKIFLKSLNLSENFDTIRNEMPPRPDISYNHPHDGFTAFELVEIVAPEVAKAMSKAKTNPDEEIPGADPSKDRIKDKLRKAAAGKYVTDHPVELIGYTNGRMVPTDDMIINQVMPMLECMTIAFRRIWLLGEKDVYLLYDDQDGGKYLKYG